ncbi:MAG: SGNH/GDSL hydrolase family protein [Acidimicrobiia bacterium]
MTRFLFAGDSVTDCGRTFFAPEVGAGELGAGWVRVVAGQLGLREPERHQFLNAGVSGDRVGDLLGRWDRDIVDHAPQVLSILIGVNDALLQPRTAFEVFEARFATLLDRVPPTVERLIIVEPFVVPATPQAAELRERHLANLEVVRAGAASADRAVLVPLDELFVRACDRAAPTWWAPDGVHPSVAGHALIADAWLEAISA